MYKKYIYSIACPLYTVYIYKVYVPSLRISYHVLNLCVKLSLNDPQQFPVIYRGAPGRGAPGRVFRHRNIRISIQMVRSRPTRH